MKEEEQEDAVQRSGTDTIDGSSEEQMSPDDGTVTGIRGRGAAEKEKEKQTKKRRKRSQFRRKIVSPVDVELIVSIARYLLSFYAISFRYVTVKSVIEDFPRVSKFFHRCSITVRRDETQSTGLLHVW